MRLLIKGMTRASAVTPNEKERYTNMTEEEKMLAGEIYDPSDAELAKKRRRAHDLCSEYNALKESEEEKRTEIINRLFPSQSGGLFVQGPVYCDYGEFVSWGKNVYANFNFTVLDCCPVEIGDNVMFGPNCSVVTPVHPLRWQERNIRFDENGRAFDLEYAKPIRIEKNCWIASNVTITGGVTIGEGSVIGAGSVVTRDIPPNSLAAGVPCRVIRKITDKDSMGI